MFQFTSGAGSPPGYQIVQPTLPNGPPSNQHVSYPQPLSVGQGYQHKVTGHTGVRRASEPATSSQPCYNCGGFNHWAQNCPEPRRPVPAGAMNPQRPFKRQKTMGPLITRYPVPPTSTNFAPNHPPPNSAHRALTHPPLNANLPQYTNTSTVVSPNSYAVRAWQHQNQLPSTLHRHPSQQWISQGSPSPISTSPISSAGGAPVQNVFPPKAYVQHHSPARTPPLRNSFPDRPSGRPPQGSLISHQSSSVSQTEFSIQSQQSEAPKGESEEQAAESWWEELRALDYPEDSYEPKHVVSHPANPVAEALPSIMRDEDVVARLPIAASLPTGTPVSKYFRNLDVEIFMRNALEGIEESKEQEDPIMAKFTEERAGISKDELIARRQRLLELNEDAESNGEEFGDADIRKSASLEGDQEGEDPSGQIADGLPTPSQSQESEEERQIREQEEKLAALGVTGFAKPVRTSIRRSVVPAAQTLSRGREQLTNSSSDAHRNALHVPIEVSEQATVDAFSSNILDNHRPNPFNDADGKGYSRRESPAGNYRNSLQTPPTSASHDSRCDNDQLYPRRSSSNSAENSLQELPANIKNIQPDPSGPRTPDTIQRDGGDKNAHSPSHTRGTMTADDKRGSPLQEQFHDHGNGGIVRKRSIRELSPEIAEGPKRQPDGCHAKDKRKAPKVAAAYGRRW